MLNGMEQRYDKRNHKKDRATARFVGRRETERREKERQNIVYKINHNQPLNLIAEPRFKPVDQQTIFNFDYRHTDFSTEIFVTDNVYKEPEPNKYNTIGDIGLSVTSVEGEFNVFIDERDFTNEFSLKNLQTIHNVYQERYAGNVNATGFGDFIRGCYYLLDFCDRNGKEFAISINHPIARFLELSQPTVEDHDTITFFTYNNCHSHYVDNTRNVRTRTGDDVDERFVKYLAHSAARLTKQTKVYVYNIVYPSHDIGERHKERMRLLLEPNQQMKQYISACLSGLGLVQYNVVHVRSGDKYIRGYNSINDASYIARLEQEINKMDLPILLIADNKQVKKLLVERNPGLKTVFKEITHFGEGFKQEYESVKNTLLDFYLMAQAKSIASLTCYEHGSGFSQWCATTYNIPYHCKFIRI